jgi:hypothetical protein
LSRLEIRRGINLQSQVDRQKAEIRLEIGASSKHSSLMHVFVGTNVLFVGTMNEDETTQTLSDKVVDRANVLRFGKPSILTRDATNGSVHNHQQLNRRLTYPVWQSWCKRDQDMAEDSSRKVDDWIERLNKAMMCIQRPFAHRTTLAIRSYVANYPSQDEEGIKTAMADQLEQKMFPKFRGLDPTDDSVRRALSEVQTVLNELGDRQLMNAIDESRNKHQFLWLGVDRLEHEEV